MIKYCVECGKEFEVQRGANGSNRITCSTGCAIKHRKQNYINRIKKIKKENIK